MNKSPTQNFPENAFLSLLILSDQPMQNRHSYSVSILEFSSDGQPHSITLQDVTELPDAAMAFVGLLLQGQVSPRQLADIVEDALPLK